MSQGIILCIDKPYGWSSFDTLRRIKKFLPEKNIKIGHAGTLDPLATGILLVCIGKATKLAESLQAAEKSYRFTLKLGSTTPSFDLETPVDQEFDHVEITTEQVEKVIHSFKGEQMQIPPLFSAKQVDGKRAYKEARQGNSLNLRPQKIMIYNTTVVDITMPYITIEVTCSKGTYIRALARDIGIQLNTGAHIVKLERTSIGIYQQQNMLSIHSVLALINKTFVTNKM